MYESNTSTVKDALKTASPVVFTDDTINKILNLTTKGSDTVVTIQTAAPDTSGNVTVPSGSEVVMIDPGNTNVPTVIAPPKNVPVVIFQGKGGVVATLNDGVTVPSSAPGTVDRVVVGSAGGDKIIVADARNTQVVLGSGDSTVTTGLGVDTVQAGLGNSTIVGGSGNYSVVKLSGTATNYLVSASNGHAVITDNTTHKVTDISKIQYVQLDQGKALVFAKDSVEAAITTLYQTAFGRTADAGGLDYWFDLGRAGVSLKQIANAFTHVSEFAAQAALSDADFVQGLYQHTFGRAGEASGVAFWTDALSHGATRADLIYQFAQVGAANIAGNVHTEAQVIGNVTIVSGII
ncbi:DUF4214 domain-containing protein [Massilia sp. TS11]|uniref:DUF4214 domain-containing protein n=1 Tax=Massilia sp. TS11 TaxID=2908003 RepID=UPI001EDC5FBD|nr:DUF4214 domain-containing protein [Massilia sp. TS11]MCG2582845.1 DUF4214 domain-containing protein [Massilia sp. TS11]